MREVLPRRLWIGNARDLRDVRRVLDAGITAVVDLAIEEPPAVYPRDIVSCRFPLLDGTGNPPGVLIAAVRTIATLMEGRVPTLVGCSGGMSRSPVVTAAALSSADAIDFDDAVRRVTASGPCDVSPGLFDEVRRAVGVGAILRRRRFGGEVLAAGGPT